MSCRFLKEKNGNGFQYGIEVKSLPFIERWETDMKDQDYFRRRRVHLDGQLVRIRARLHEAERDPARATVARAAQIELAGVEREIADLGPSE